MRHNIILMCGGISKEIYKGGSWRIGENINNFNEILKALRGKKKTFPIFSFDPRKYKIYANINKQAY